MIYGQDLAIGGVVQNSVKDNERGFYDHPAVRVSTATGWREHVWKQFEVAHHFHNGALFFRVLDFRHEKCDCGFGPANFPMLAFISNALYDLLVIDQSP